MKNGNTIIAFIVALALSACVSFPAQAVSFELVDENSEDQELYTSSDYLGMPMVLEFYFAGCPSCDRNAENLNRLATDHHGISAQIVEVSIDCDDSDYEYWIRRHEPFWPVLNDCRRTLARNQGVSAYPTTLVLNARHQVVYRTVGMWSSSTYNRIDRLISNPISSR